MLAEGPAGAIDLALNDPGESRRGIALIAHPHPLQGGTRDNKVVTTLARSAQALGAATIRFNYRGVGASSGSYDEGRGEIDDALAAVAEGRQRWPDAALWLAGFSFGGIVALRASRATPL